MDLKAILAKAAAAKANSVVVPITPKAPIVGLCKCGHPKDAHEVDPEGDNSMDCMILECACNSYFPESQSPSVDKIAAILKAEDRSPSEQTAPPAERQTNKVTKCDICEETPCVTPMECDAERSTTKKKKLGFLIPPGTKITDTCAEVKAPAPAEEMETEVVSVDTLAEWDNDMSKCHHLCSTEGCGKWWTHGPVEKCRYPDLVNQGKCPTCLGVTGETNVDPLSGFENGKLTADGEIRVRNRERVICKDMNIEQLTRHIEFLAKEIEALRIKSLETRKMRAELEEAELADVPEEERNKFIQALRQGSKKESKPRKARTPKVSSDPGVRLSAYDRNVEKLMRTLGKTRQEVEAFLND